eukprot:TRINITY_DN5400_c0_g2_i1.p1 TRINITY_DN5400_c0_g2~~TRINITY_DN5400_c0_g2_i1.p1  ORF type:complete len:405 (+),score=82.59 TRINITY_DN5400_c0_g2_i1:23-1216(+)
MEACGVDNARIEIEGGDEVPVFDGSALGWVQEIYKSGLKPAAQEGQDENLLTPKLYFSPQHPVQVSNTGAHITFAPDVHFKCSYGIDMGNESTIIGKQWYHYDLFLSQPFYSELAAAKDWVPSLHYLYQMYELGFYRGGTEGTTIIAHNDNYIHPEILRYPFDECVRHRLVDLIGDLALLGKQGHGGIPMGHVTAFMGNHELHYDFVLELAKQLAPENLQMYTLIDHDHLLMHSMKLTDDQLNQLLSWKEVIGQKRMEVEGQQEEYEKLQEKYQDKLLKGENLSKIRDDLINELGVEVDEEDEVVIPEDIQNLMAKAQAKIEQEGDEQSEDEEQLPTEGELEVDQDAEFEQAQEDIEDMEFDPEQEELMIEEDEFEEEEEGFEDDDEDVNGVPQSDI